MNRLYVESRLRGFLLLLAGFAFISTIGELLLQEHTKETLQLIPLGLCLAGLVAVVVVWLRPGRGNLRVLRVVMVIVALGGLFGMGIHLLGNYTFEQEIRPNAVAADLILDTLKGAAPLLAPGTLIFAAVVAIAATYYHPLLGGRIEADFVQ